MLRKRCLRALICLKPSRLVTITVVIAAVVLISGCVPWSDPSIQATQLLPSATLVLLPDLVIQSIELVTPEQRVCSDPNAGLSMRIEISNQGDGPADAFSIWVNQKQFTIASGLAARDQTILFVDGFENSLRVEVDPDSRVVEKNEVNNTDQITLAFPTLPAECLPTPTPEIITTRQALYTMLGHTGKVTSVAFSPDGNLVASGSTDNSLRLWRVKEGKLLRTMLGHPFPVTRVIFSPNGANLATGSSDGIIRIWSVSNGLLTRNLQGHGGAITALRFTPNNQRLISSAQDFTVRIWNASDGRLLKTIDEGMAVVTSLACSSDSKELAWAEEDGSLRLIRLSDGAWLDRWRGINLPAGSLALSPDSKLAASGYQDGRIQLWALPGGTLLQTLEGHRGAVTSLDFSPDGQWLASSSEDGSVRLWQIETQALADQGAPVPAIHPTPIEVYLGHSGHVNQAAFSPKGNQLASGGDDGTVRLWAIP